MVVDETSGIAYTIGFQSPDQTGPTYALTPADQGATIKVRVTFTDDDGYQESLTSAATEPVAARPNTEATGAPTISGTPQVDKTLTADTSGIDDADGLTNVSYRYQWTAGGSDISGATGSSHLLTADEQGQTVQVKVTFTDDAANQESLTSAETLAVAAKPNTAATGEPTISGTPQVEQILTADTSGISDANGLNNVSYQYQWLRDDADIAGQTNSTYELVSADEGKTIKVRVTFNDDAGNAESLTSTATTAVAAQPAETPVDLLTASFANVPADHNGENFTFQLTFSENVEAGYARIRDHAFTVTGATIDSASRITQGSNQGWNVEVNPTGNGSVSITLPETTDCNAARAICTDDERKLSHPTSETVAGPPAISVSDAAVQEAEGAALVFTVTLSHASSRTVTVSYATQDGTAQAGSDYTAASGTLTFNPGDTSQTVSVTVLTDSDDEGEETLTLTISNPSQATLDDASGIGTIENGESSSGTQEDPPAEDPPVETPAVLLTASFANMPADHNGSTFTFQLNFSENVEAGYARIRDHALTVTGGSIDSASRITQGSNQGWNVEVDPTGNGSVSITLPETTDCNATGAICTEDGRPLSNRLQMTVTGPLSADQNTPATGLPTISGTVQVDQTLTADVSSIADADGLTNVSYSYQWIRNDGGTDADIAGETASTHTLVSADEGKTIKVRVSFTDDAGNEETLTSAATAAVASRPNTPATGLPTISGTVQVDETLTADTSGISDSDGLTNVSYSYQWIRNDGGTDADMGGQTGSTYTLVSADEGKAIKVRVSFTDDAGNEETLTSAATAAVAVRPNTPATGLPTISGTAQVDETLTADTSGISDSDGLTNVSYSYQWIRNDGTNDADIGGQTGSTYTLVSMPTRGRPSRCG